MRVRCTPVRGPAVQIVSQRGGVRRIVEHLGQTHNVAEQGPEPLAPAPGRTGRTHHNGDQLVGSVVEALHDTYYTRLGLGEAVGDGWALEQTIAARLPEPISKAQPHRILGNPGGGRR